MCVRVCFWMLSRAPFTSAARAVFRTSQVERAHLDLPGPDRSCPFAFDVGAGVPNMSMGDMGVSDMSGPASLLPLAFGALSAEQERFRQEVRRTPQSIFTSSAALGTVRPYGATLRALAPKVAAKLSSRALLTDSESAFYACHSWSLVPVFRHGVACGALELRAAG